MEPEALKVDVDAGLQQIFLLLGTKLKVTGPTYDLREYADASLRLPLGLRARDICPGCPLLVLVPNRSIRGLIVAHAQHCHALGPLPTVRGSSQIRCHRRRLLLLQGEGKETKQRRTWASFFIGGKYWGKRAGGGGGLLCFCCFEVGHVGSAAFVISDSLINHGRGGVNAQWLCSAGGLSRWMPGFQPLCSTSVLPPCLPLLLLLSLATVKLRIGSPYMSSEYISLSPLSFNAPISQSLLLSPPDAAPLSLLSPLSILRILFRVSQSLSHRNADSLACLRV